MIHNRRQLMGGSAAALAFSGFAARALAQQDAAAPNEGAAREAIQRLAYRSDIYGYGPLVRDPAGVFDLPADFSCRVISQEGERMDDGLAAPGNFDGMSCFDIGGGDVALVRNHELRITDERRSAWSAGGRVPRREAYYDQWQDERPTGGGTSTLVYDLSSGRVRRRNLSLAGTRTNCAGGRTPWGSWLTCEETVQKAGEDGHSRDHGWVFEVPAAGRGLADPIPLKGLGRFIHEAATVDPRTGVVYLTEDIADGLFYRFLPDDRRNLAGGGRLQALGFRGQPGADARNWESRIWNLGEWRDAVWIDMAGPENPDNDLRERGRAAGAATFARGEGIFVGHGELYFTCTSAGPGRLGQILRYRPSPVEGQVGERDDPGRLQLFIEPTEASLMRMPDNITIAPWGHLIVCEDKSGGVNFLKGVTPDGQIYTLGRVPTPSRTDPENTTEIAGVCFSPDGTTMFLNLFSPGRTLAITGPWSRFIY